MFIEKFELLGYLKFTEYFLETRICFSVQVQWENTLFDKFF